MRAERKKGGDGVVREVVLGRERGIQDYMCKKAWIEELRELVLLV